MWRERVSIEKQICKIIQYITRLTSYHKQESLAINSRSISRLGLVSMSEYSSHLYKANGKSREGKN